MAQQEAVSMSTDRYMESLGYSTSRTKTDAQGLASEEVPSSPLGGASYVRSSGPLPSNKTDRKYRTSELDGYVFGSAQKPRAEVRPPPNPPASQGSLLKRRGQQLNPIKVSRLGMDGSRALEDARPVYVRRITTRRLPSNDPIISPPSEESIAQDMDLHDRYLPQGAGSTHTLGHASIDERQPAVSHETFSTLPATTYQAPKRPVRPHDYFNRSQPLDIPSKVHSKPLRTDAANQILNDPPPSKYMPSTEARVRKPTTDKATVMARDRERKERKEREEREEREERKEREELAQRNKSTFDPVKELEKEVEIDAKLETLDLDPAPPPKTQEDGSFRDPWSELVDDRYNWVDAEEAEEEKKEGWEMV